jgi:uncharacterized membrane protein
MTTAHLHLLLNHFPILGSIFITVLFIIALAYRNIFLQKVSLWFLVAIALFTAATYLTGDGAVQAVKGLPGISEEAIHAHELFAKVGLGLMFVTGALALASALLYSFRPKLPRLLLVLVLLALLLNSVVFVYIGYLGGQIHHQELRSSSYQQISSMH